MGIPASGITGIPASGIMGVPTSDIMGIPAGDITVLLLPYWASEKRSVIP